MNPTFEFWLLVLLAILVSGVVRNLRHLKIRANDAIEFSYADGLVHCEVMVEVEGNGRYFWLIFFPSNAAILKRPLEEEVAMLIRRAVQLWSIQFKSATETQRPDSHASLEKRVRQTVQPTFAVGQVIAVISFTPTLNPEPAVAESDDPPEVKPAEAISQKYDAIGEVHEAVEQAKAKFIRKHPTFFEDEELKGSLYEEFHLDKTRALHSGGTLRDRIRDRQRSLKRRRNRV